MTVFTRTRWDGNRDAVAYRNCSADCALCGRPVNFDRAVIIAPQWLDGEQFTLLPVSDWTDEVDADPAEWVGPESIVGSHCAKQLPKAHKMTVKRAYALYRK